MELDTLLFAKLAVRSVVRRLQKHPRDMLMKVTAGGRGFLNSVQGEAVKAVGDRTRERIEASRVMHTSSLEFVELGSARRPAVLLALTTHRFDTHITRRRIAHGRTRVCGLANVPLSRRTRAFL